MARILLVEDNPNNQNLFRTALSHYGHEVELVGDGERALARVEGGMRPDLIVLDLSIPKVDGWTVARTIREHAEPAVSKLCILALTAHAMKGDRERALEAGCDDYLSKPVSPRELAKRVAKLVERAQAA